MHRPRVQRRLSAPPTDRAVLPGSKGSQELDSEEEFGCVETAKDSRRDAGKPQLAQPLIY